MSIERIHSENSVRFTAMLQDDSFRIDANSLRPPALGEQFTAEEIRAEVEWLLRKPAGKRTFIIGPLSKRIDSTTGRMYPQDIDFIEQLHQFYELLGIDAYSSFRREEYGYRGIQDTQATLLDRLAIETSHVLMVLPGSSESSGAQREISYAAARGRSFIFLFDEHNPETEFRQSILAHFSSLTTPPPLIFVSYTSDAELFRDLGEVWTPLRTIATTDEEWRQHITAVKAFLSQQNSNP